jgi:hypothetical protein
MNRCYCSQAEKDGTVEEQPDAGLHETVQEAEHSVADAQAIDARSVDASPNDVAERLVRPSVRRRENGSAGQMQKHVQKPGAQSSRERWPLKR